MKDSEILGQLAMAQALYHELGRMVKTGDPGNLRGRADAMLDDGVTDKINLRINGKSVGTLSNRYSTPETFLVIDDAEKFAAWLAGDGFGYLREWVARGCKGDILKLCASALAADGEIPEGCRAVESEAYRIGTVIKGCKADEVAAAFAGNLPQAVVYALTGEVEP